MAEIGDVDTRPDDPAYVRVARYAADGSGELLGFDWVREGETLEKRLWLTLLDDRGERVDVYTVDGEYVARYLDVGMAEGGNEYADPEVVPRGQVYLWQCMSEATRLHVLVHEMDERRQMRDGVDYDDAHPPANDAEADYLRETLDVPAPHLSD